jgi:hypothetical protein
MLVHRAPGMRIKLSGLRISRSLLVAPGRTHDTGRPDIWLAGVPADPSQFLPGSAR